MGEAWGDVALADIAQLNRETVDPSKLGDAWVDHYSLPAFDAGTPERVKADQIGSLKLRVPPGAVLASRLNPNIPRIWTPIIDRTVESICSSEFAVLTATKCAPSFLRYFIESDDIYGRLNEMVNGTSSSHQRVSSADIMAMRATLPPPDVQRGIAELMCTLDGLLASIKREERLLLEYGLACFDAAVESSEPTVLRVDAAASFNNRRRVPLSRMERDKRVGPYPYYGATGVFGHVDDYLFDGLYVLVGEDGSVIEDDGAPVLQIAHGKFWVNNHAHVLSGKNVPTEALWFALRNLAVDPAVTGAVQPKLSMGRLSALEILYPADPTEFELVAKQCILHVLKSRDERLSLVELRAFLLPKLLSGELRVQDAKEWVEVGP